MSASVSAPDLRHIDVWLFDLDNTLYPARCNLFAQIDVRIGRYISDWLKVDAEEARRVQKQYWRDHGTSMRGMMSLHGVDPKHYLDYVHDIDYSPVEANPALEKSLAALPGRKLIFTAGDVPHAEKVMERLGVAHHFEAIFDIVAGDYWPKPHKQIYEQLVKKHNVDARKAAMVDDIAINLRPAHDLGMRTVWVRTEESVKRAEGVPLEPEFMKIAVPGTRAVLLRADLAKISSGRPTSLIHSRISRRPLAQVVSSVKATPPTSSGNQPPSGILVALAAK